MSRPQMLTPKSFIAALDNVEDVNRHYAFIDLYANQGDLATLKDLFLELSQQKPGSEIPEWALAAVRERIIEAPALTDGLDNAVTALELAAAADSQKATVGSVRLTASGSFEGRRGTAVRDHRYSPSQDE